MNYNSSYGSIIKIVTYLLYKSYIYIYMFFLFQWSLFILSSNLDEVFTYNHMALITFEDNLV